MPLLAKTWIGGRLSEMHVCVHACLVIDGRFKCCKQHIAGHVSSSGVARDCAVCTCAETSVCTPRFAHSCFYKHAYPDGSLEPREVVLRTARDDEGGSHVIKAVRLSDFFETAQASALLARRGVSRRNM